jgi:hypothetical protein
MAGLGGVSVAAVFLDSGELSIRSQLERQQYTHLQKELVRVFVAREPIISGTCRYFGCTPDWIYEGALMLELRLTGRLYRDMISDLERPHQFAAERVGFVLGRAGSLANGGKVVLLTKYHPIPDDEYIRDFGVGARIGSEAITWAMQTAYFGRKNCEGVFHVHLHSHGGAPRMSFIDNGTHRN